MKDTLPCLDLLEATPAILRGLMSGISDEDARWKPAGTSGRSRSWSARASTWRARGGWARTIT